MMITLQRAAQESNIQEILPRSSGYIKFIRDLCDYKKPTQDYCLDILGNTHGEHRANIDRVSVHIFHYRLVYFILDYSLGY